MTRALTELIEEGLEKGALPSNFGPSTDAKSASALGRALAPHDVFISYRREDTDFAQKLRTTLEARDYSVWFDRDLQPGAHFHKEIEVKLSQAKCIIVLWSAASVASQWVLHEAAFALSRQVLVAVRLDDCEVPHIFQRVKTLDIPRGADARRSPGMAALINDVEQLVVAETSRPTQPLTARNLRKQLVTNFSVSDPDTDCDRILSVLVGASPKLLQAIENGYDHMRIAQKIACEVLSDAAPLAHFQAAKDYFRRALDLLGDSKLWNVSDGRSVEYYLTMAMADCLVESCRGADHSLDHALDIYEHLAGDARFRDDIPLHIRWGAALSRKVGDAAAIQKAIRVLQRARSMTAAPDAAPAGSRFCGEIAKELGVCNFRLSAIPGTSKVLQQRYLDEAIELSREADAYASQEVDISQLWLRMKAANNLLYLLAQRVRDDRGSPQDEADINTTMAWFREPRVWDLATNQVWIIDTMATASAAVRLWDQAQDLAELNCENFATLATTGLSKDELVMEARAKEINFFCQEIRRLSSRDQHRS
jgi:TIR domain